MIHYTREIMMSPFQNYINMMRTILMNINMCMDNDINNMLDDIPSPPSVDESHEYKHEEQLIPPKTENIVTSRISNTLVKRCTADITPDTWELLG